MEFPVLENFDLDGKRVLLRVDINSPIEPKTKEILDDTRIRGHLPTIRALSSAKVVVLAHQSRPGLDDFTNLEKHAKRFGELLQKEVKFVEDVFDKKAKKAVEDLKKGEVLVLDNVRFCREEIDKEISKKPPEEQAKTELVQKLSSYVDFFVNDAFAVSHRSQPSIVGFPIVLQSCAGRLLQEEVRMLSKVHVNEKPKVFLFGGVKADDTFDIITKVLNRNIADTVLTSGIVANIFLIAKGCNIGEENKKFLINKNLDHLIPEAEKLLKVHKEKIIVPVDLAFQKNNARVEASINKFPNYRVLDIGIETIVQYSKIIKNAKFVVANGPAGVFEIDAFALGTVELLKAMANSQGFSIVGGGHLSVIAQSINLSDKISYMSTGGKATMAFLAGDKLPGIEVLKRRSARAAK